jgi:succinyl-diaminopimelate desuccinylase
MATVDPVALTGALVRCPSLTPREAGCFDLLEDALRPLGFEVERLRFASPGAEPVDNLWARAGQGRPHLAFNGHVDVVPPGDPGRWRDDPFAGVVRDGRLYGRGAADMKSAVAAFVAATDRHLARSDRRGGSLTLLITADEEGPAVDGTAKLLEWAHTRGERYDACLVGEPTSREVLGDAAKIGRRGSLQARLTAHGRQGHTAYAELAANAAHAMVRLLTPLIAEPIDAGTSWFPPTSLQVATIDVGNPAGNVIPGAARAVIDIRYGDLQTAATLEAWLRERLDRAGTPYALELAGSGDAFRTEPGPLVDTLVAAVRAVTGRTPELNTKGGTSDARFVRRYCPVVELGLVGTTIHQVDEHVAVADIEGLTAIYTTFLDRFLAAA